MEWDKKTALLAIFILFGSSTGILNTIAPDLRAGSFTRADFLEEKAKIVQEDEERMDVLRNRITTLEQQMLDCKRDIEKCRNTVNRH